MRNTYVLVGNKFRARTRVLLVKELYCKIVWVLSAFLFLLISAFSRVLIVQLCAS